MSSDLRQLADAATDERSFVEFVRALARDWNDGAEKDAQQPTSPYGPGANGWEHDSIGSYLEAAAEWAAATVSEAKFYVPPTNPWTRVAHVLLAGKSYE
jgi:hypothetical protein